MDKDFTGEPFFVLVVNGMRYLMRNLETEDENYVDKKCQEIIESYGPDAVIEFDYANDYDIGIKHNYPV